MSSNDERNVVVYNLGFEPKIFLRETLQALFLVFICYLLTDFIAKTLIVFPLNFSSG